MVKALRPLPYFKGLKTRSHGVETRPTPTAEALTDPELGGAGLGSEVGGGHQPRQALCGGIPGITFGNQDRF